LEARLAELELRMAALDRRLLAFGRHARFQVALAASVVLHAIVIFGVTFTMPDPAKLFPRPQTLEVTLVNAKTQARPQRADALAQANLDGGGNTDAPRRARSPLPVPRDARQASDLAAAQKRVEQLEREARRLMTQARSPTAVAAAPEAPREKSEPQLAPSAAEILNRSFQIARLEASIAREWENYQQRPRRRFIGARTQEYRFARYIEDWRLKIERVGELNYPQAARDQRIYGSLVVTVAIRSDGSLERVEINRSSGERILDEAARRIVHLAAPFAPFPPDIARDTDILHITRTWLFTRSDQFIAE
ncbi:MAG TPA: TonB family protein, partial [Burkholderiales bacterium]|nr:TonB family protein [Burkholderiales bacterium]